MADTRIQLQPLSGLLYPEREVYVGWDQALQTYHARVTNGVDEAGAERVTLTVGSGPGEFTEPTPEVNAAAQYAQVPERIRKACHESTALKAVAHRGLSTSGLA